MGHFVDCPLTGNLDDVFLMIRLELWVFGRKTTEVKCHSDSTISRTHTMHMTYYKVDLDCPDEVMFARSLHCKVTLLSSSPHCTLWKDVSMSNPEHGAGTYVPPP